MSLPLRLFCYSHGALLLCQLARLIILPPGLLAAAALPAAEKILARCSRLTSLVDGLCSDLPSGEKVLTPRSYSERVRNMTTRGGGEGWRCASAATRAIEMEALQRVCVCFISQQEYLAGKMLGRC